MSKVITIPCKVFNFEELGFYISDREPYSLNPNSSVRGMSLRSEEGNHIPTIIFAGNIKMGNSLEDVKATYGEPDC